MTSSFYRSVENNRLDGAVPSTIWNDIVLTGNRSLILDFQNNSLKTIPAAFNPPQNVTVMHVLIRCMETLSVEILVEL